MSWRRVSDTMAEFVPVNLLPARVAVDRRDGGEIRLRSPEPLAPYARCVGEYLEHWARERPDRVFIAQRDGSQSDHWRMMNYEEARDRVRAVATALLQRDLSPSRPIAILSEN